MSKIRELIKEKCPNGVEYKKLKDITEMKRGQSITTQNLIEGSIPVIAGGQVPSFYNNKFNREGETITVSSSGAYAGFLNYWNQPILCTDSFSIKSQTVNLKYLYYFLKMKQNEIYNKKTGAGIPHVYISDLENMKIPIPPLEVQEEIVRILDKFVKLQAELEEDLNVELETIKQQYEFWRKYLFNDDNIKNIEDICLNISSGGTPNTSRREYYAGNIPWLRTQEVNWNIIYDTELKITEEAIKNSSAKVIPRNCVIVAMYGATVGKVAINNIPLSTNQACCNLEINPRIADYKYVFYWLSSQYKYIKSLGQGSQTNINAQIVRKLKIPIPPIKEQQKIVQILDKFDKLVNDILEELSVEVDLRKKQYEYYRNKLLSFEELGND